MKLSSTQNLKAKSGMTLLELTVVILVLLSLISILFVGARAWKKGSDRSANILNIRNSQQAMRGHQNMNELAVGGAFTSTELVQYMKVPTGVATVTYTPGTTVTAIGALWLVASADGLEGADYGPTVGSTSQW
ncbi:prepilin-type N-terminal cleavage/methylation domain-containing protein [bacterium]|nr:prepilin-type N-terminal cleavage/methylation domain-containing protein [bacterium]